MNTITHALAAAVALNTTGAPVRNAAVFLGALVPDLWIFGFYGWSKFVDGETSNRIWSVLYWQEPWQTIGAVFNSAPLFAGLLALGVVLRSTLLVVVSAAALIHIGLDFPVHADDAHRHLWPLTDWRFHSPISYWDPQHHGRIVSLLEIAGAMALIVVLWRRVNALWVKAILTLAAFGYAAVPAYFILSLGG
ncbi:MAG: hypothetical protein AAFY27_06385 [Pseudomonadota bacterium]